VSFYFRAVIWDARLLLLFHIRFQCYSIHKLLENSLPSLPKLEVGTNAANIILRKLSPTLLYSVHSNLVQFPAPCCISTDIIMMEGEGNTTVLLNVNRILLFLLKVRKSRSKIGQLAQVTWRNSSMHFLNLCFMCIILYHSKFPLSLTHSVIYSQYTVHDSGVDPS